MNFWLQYWYGPKFSLIIKILPSSSNEESSLTLNCCTTLKTYNLLVWHTFKKYIKKKSQCGLIRYLDRLNLQSRLKYIGIFAVGAMLKKFVKSRHAKVFLPLRKQHHVAHYGQNLKILSKKGQITLTLVRVILSKMLSFSLDRQPGIFSKGLVWHFVKSFLYLRILKTCKDFWNHGQGDLVIISLF